MVEEDDQVILEEKTRIEAWYRVTLSVVTFGRKDERQSRACLGRRATRLALAL